MFILKLSVCNYVYTYTYINRQVALAIINSSHWEKALKGCDKDSSTPLRLLIKYLPGMYMLNDLQ